jgi:hypothetical protein
MLTTIINHPNRGFNRFASIRFEAYIPINTPMVDMPENTHKKGHSMLLPVLSSQANPAKEFRTIMLNDVPIAIFIGI